MSGGCGVIDMGGDEGGGAVHMGGQMGTVYFYAYGLLLVNRLVGLIGIILETDNVVI